MTTVNFTTLHPRYTYRALFQSRLLLTPPRPRAFARELQYTSYINDSGIVVSPATTSPSFREKLTPSQASVLDLSYFLYTHFSYIPFFRVLFQPPPTDQHARTSMSTSPSLSHDVRLNSNGPALFPNAQAFFLARRAGKGLRAQINTHSHIDDEGERETRKSPRIHARSREPW